MGHIFFTSLQPRLEFVQGQTDESDSASISVPRQLTAWPPVFLFPTSQTGQLDARKTATPKLHTPKKDTMFEPHQQTPEYLLFSKGLGIS